MPKDKTQSHIRIIEAAKREFMEYGFQDASMRRIAGEAGIQVGGLYKHFASKEEMFASLVDPMIEELMRLYHIEEENEFEAIGASEIKEIWKNREETIQTMTYIYDHLDEFKLLICRSQGTQYENFVHEFALLEEKTTMRYMQELKAKGIQIKDVDPKEFHLLVTANIEAILQTVVHGFTREEALHYAKTLDRFFTSAWLALFNI